MWRSLKPGSYQFTQKFSHAPLFEKIPDGALIEFIDKDYATHESAKSIQPDRFIKLKNRFEPID